MTRPPLTPLRTDGLPNPLPLRAEYFEGQLDPRQVRAHLGSFPVLSSNPLVLELERGRWAYLAPFGAVVFWNCPEPLTRAFLAELGPLEGLGARIEASRDDLLVHLGAPADTVGFSEVALRELTLEHLKVISLALAQSVALDRIESAVSGAMARYEPVVRTLTERGRLTLPRPEVLRIVGFSLQVRGEVLENLTLFDDPPETWESEALAHLDSDLYDQFDLEERLKAVHQKLAYLQDAGAMFLDLLTTRKNHRLEWIIIILIAVEIGMTLVKEWMARHP